MNTAENQRLWDSRAALGATSGTQDLILKQLEQRAVLAQIAAMALVEDDTVVEFGCGLGETASLVADAVNGAMVFAHDSSAEMIRLAKYQGHWNLVFHVGDVETNEGEAIRLVYTQRCLINLPSWNAQKRAIDNIARMLRPGGVFLMCEHSQEGLDYINEVRRAWRRPPLPAVLLQDGTPRNRYFRDAELATITSLKLLRCVHFSATYYYHSRILNDKLSEAEGKLPAYDAPINQLALRLPWDCVDPRFAQARLWIWEKAQ